MNSQFESTQSSAESELDLDEEQKLEIFDFRENNPQTNFDVIGKIFAEKFGAPIDGERVREIWSNVDRRRGILDLKSLKLCQILENFFPGNIF